MAPGRDGSCKAFMQGPVREDPSRTPKIASVKDSRTCTRSRRAPSRSWCEGLLGRIGTRSPQDLLTNSTWISTKPSGALLDMSRPRSPQDLLTQTCTRSCKERLLRGAREKRKRNRACRAKMSHGHVTRANFQEKLQFKCQPKTVTIDWREFAQWKQIFMGKSPWANHKSIDK